LEWKKPAETFSVLAQQNPIPSYPEPFIVVLGNVTDRRVLLHHERPIFPSSKRAKALMNRGYTATDENGAS
jgi:hypothetical protein